ncbi:MAG: S1C family serine protease [candidate division Zixibacteria bacterium]
MINCVAITKTARSSAVFFSILSLIIAASVQAQTLESLDFEIAQIIDRVSPAVVTIEARSQDSNTPLFPLKNNNNLSNPVRAVVGSGVIIDSSGHIMTVLSLVDGFDYFYVLIDDAKITAELVGTDRRLNLAVLKIDTDILPRIELSPYPPFAGRLALAFGRSLGGTGYPALGIIAGRQNDGSFLMSGSIMPGIIGGGVFGLSGRLIGLITSGGSIGQYSSEQMMGGILMLPAGAALTAAERIILYGDREAGYLGLKTTAIEMVDETGQVRGEAVVVSAVDAGSPAHRAGISTGDIITHFANYPITNDRELQRLAARWGVDSTVNIEYIRSGNELSMTLTLSSYMPDMYEKQSDPTNKDIITAFKIQNRIDSLRIEMSRLQTQLDKLISRFSSSR